MSAMQRANRKSQMAAALANRTHARVSIRDSRFAIRRSSGFTLLEVMLATLLLALLLAGT